LLKKCDETTWSFFRISKIVTAKRRLCGKSCMITARRSRVKRLQKIWRKGKCLKLLRALTRIRAPQHGRRPSKTNLCQILTRAGIAINLDTNKGKCPDLHVQAIEVKRQEDRRGRGEESRATGHVGQSVAREQEIGRPHPRPDQIQHVTVRNPRLNLRA
jgi:hypothetical protein